MPTPSANVAFANTPTRAGFSVDRKNSLKFQGTSPEDVLLNLRMQAGNVPGANWIVDVVLTPEPAADRSLTRWIGQAVAAEVKPV